MLESELKGSDSASLGLVPSAWFPRSARDRRNDRLFFPVNDDVVLNKVVVVDVHLCVYIKESSSQSGGPEDTSRAVVEEVI